MDRREFLKIFGLGAGALLFGRKALAPPPVQPNILLIMTDEQTASAMSCVGNPYVSTPNMDRIAADGVLFEKAYATTPLCRPFRTTMVTGMLPHETGVTDNTDTFSIPVPPTMGRIINDAGYDCGYFGKWHIPISTGDVATHGFDSRSMGINGLDRNLEAPSVQFINNTYGGGTRSAGDPWFLVVSFVNPHDICEFAQDDNYHKNDDPSNPIPTPPYTPLSICPPLPSNHEREANQPTPLLYAQTDPYGNKHKDNNARTSHPRYPRYHQGS